MEMWAFTPKPSFCIFVSNVAHNIYGCPFRSCDLEVCRAVIELCGEVATLASPVVCNSSPEGFLPGTQVPHHFILSTSIHVRMAVGILYVCVCVLAVASGVGVCRVFLVGAVWRLPQWKVQEHSLSSSAAGMP